MGVRGGPNPRGRVRIGSFIGSALEAAGADLSQYDDLTLFDVDILHPGRTLLEKMYAIHGLARQLAANILETDKLRRNGRHFYDVYKLLGEARVLGLLADRPQTREIMASIEETSQEEFKATGELRADGGFAASLAFDRNSGISDQMRHAYEGIMPALYFGAEPLPAWGEICTRVQAQHQLL